MQTKIWLTVALTIATATGCAAPVPPQTGTTPPPMHPSLPNAPTNNASLANTEWVVQSIQGVNPSVLQSLTNPILANFVGTNSFNGTDGCNNIGSTYTANGNNLTINTSTMHSTMMACLSNADSAKSAYMNALSRTAHYQNTGNMLQLLDNKGQVLAVLAKPASNLIGTEWRLNNYLVPNLARVGSIYNDQMSISFNKDGRVTGSTGCNTFFSSYSIQNDVLTLSPIGSTSRMCTNPDQARDEAAVLNNLNQVKRFKRSGNQLQLLNAKGESILEYRL